MNAYKYSFSQDVYKHPKVVKYLEEMMYYPKPVAEYLAYIISEWADPEDDKVYVWGQPDDEDKTIGEYYDEDFSVDEIAELITGGDAITYWLDTYTLTQKFSVCLSLKDFADFAKDMGEEVTDTDNKTYASIENVAYCQKVSPEYCLIEWII